MPRPVRPWFRFYTESFSDRKMLRLSPLQRWLWVSILGAARESPVPGELLIADDEPMTIEELARYADVRPRDVSSALPIMERLGMIEQKERSIVVLNWNARQYESDNVTARTRDHRERSKEQDRNVPKNVRRNTPDTETETEEEKSRPRKRGARLPEEWIPSDETRQLIASERPDLDLRKEHQDFCDYWHAKAGKDATKIDWDLTWRRWMRNQGQRPGGGQPALTPVRAPFTPEPPPAEIADDPEACERWYTDQYARRSA